jgi:hypothetical protein
MVFPRDIVCLRNISVDTLHKGDTDDDDEEEEEEKEEQKKNNNNKNKKTTTTTGKSMYPNEYKQVMQVG